MRGISRIAQMSYGTVVSFVRGASQKAQMIHNKEVQQVETDAIVGDELWSFVEKKHSSVSAWRVRSRRLLDRAEFDSGEWTDS